MQRESYAVKEKILAVKEFRDLQILKQKRKKDLAEKRKLKAIPEEKARMSGLTTPAVWPPAAPSRIGMPREE